MFLGNYTELNRVLKLRTRLGIDSHPKAVNGINAAKKTQALRDYFDAEYIGIVSVCLFKLPLYILSIVNFMFRLGLHGNLSKV